MRDLSATSAVDVRSENVYRRRTARRREKHGLPSAKFRTAHFSGESFAIETTLRSQITFEQALLARASGFSVVMIYVALDSFEKHFERVQQRAILGGHAACGTLRRIYERSLANLPIALKSDESGIQFLRVFDNSAFQRPPIPALEVENGRVIRVARDFPSWLRTALGWNDYDVALRAGRRE